MREIKFRAWDKNNNLMVYVDDNHWAKTVAKMIGSFEDEDLMQYTGLKDKKGKEIYELMEINDTYRIIYKVPSYVLQDISTGDIIKYDEQKTYKVTGEYSPMEKN